MFVALSEKAPIWSTEGRQEGHDTGAKQQVPLVNYQLALLTMLRMRKIEAEGFQMQTSYN